MQWIVWEKLQKNMVLYCDKKESRRVDSKASFLGDVGDVGAGR